MSRADDRMAAPVRRDHAVRLSIVLPMYNEAQVIGDLFAQLTQVVGALEGVTSTELVCVNDGSRDGTGAALDALATDAPAPGRPAVRAVHLARNFGHQAAVLCGLAHARGDVVVVMDADLQDDPAALPRFLDGWRAGDDVVYAVRVKRKESIAKRAAFAGFHRLLGGIARTPIPVDAGNFSLLDRRVVDAVVALPEVDRYFPGLRAWIGFRQRGVPVERNPRYDDQPRVSFGGLVRLAKTAIFGFSSLPLTVFYGLAVLSGLAFAGVAGFALYHKLFTGLAIPGWASILMAACFFGALNALGIAVLGEYVIRIYDQVRRRPTYLVARASGDTEETA
ncbi:MAG: glycosyltransferase family 2 protein [Acidobacteriota bacterium]